jgi:hypothetical protein
MNWTPNAADPQIFHITHVDNLKSILKEGGLWSDAKRIAKGFDSTNIGYSHIKARRLQRPIPVAKKGMLGDYVPFNFCPRSVMLYVVSRGHENYSGGQRGIVHLVSRASQVRRAKLPWAFTDRHADLGYAEYFDDFGKIGEVDFGVMAREQWGGDSDLKERRQAEFLVHDFFPWSLVEEIAVYGEAEKKAVEILLAKVSRRPPVVVRPDWYY